MSPKFCKMFHRSITFTFLFFKTKFSIFLSSIYIMTQKAALLNTPLMESQWGICLHSEANFSLSFNLLPHRHQAGSNGSRESGCGEDRGSRNRSTRSKARRNTSRSEVAGMARRQRVQVDSAGGKSRKHHRAQGRACQENVRWDPRPHSHPRRSPWHPWSHCQYPVFLFFPSFIFLSLFLIKIKRRKIFFNYTCLFPCQTLVQFLLLSAQIEKIKKNFVDE